jgi:hypothetical protein
MALRDLSGAVDFGVLEATTGGDDGISEEVLGLFAQQAALWSPMLDVREEGWRDAVHTLRGAAAGIGAGALAEAVRRRRLRTRLRPRRCWTGCMTRWRSPWPTWRPTGTS